jgi:transcriptional regulator with XRE-family HTH domain
MAKSLGCHLVSYQQWESGRATPQAIFYPKIIELLGGLPFVEADTVGGKLGGERLTRGLNLVEMAGFVGLSIETWSRLESGEYPPTQREIETLKQHSIDLGDTVCARVEDIPTTLSKALRDARLERGFSQAELAQSLGYKDASSWSRIETVGRVPCRRKWSKIEEVLGVDVSHIV